MGIKLYAVDLSPPVRAALMGFEIFNVPYEKIELNLAANEHKSPEYLKINPLHSIPVMVDGDFILHDSHAILAYLADTYGKDDSWYPKDVKKRALVNQKLFFDTSILFPRLRTVTYPIVIEGKKTIEQKLLDDIDEAYVFFEEFLNRTTYLAADHVTIADVAALGNMTTLEFLLPVDAKKYPKITAWLTNLKKTPYCIKQNETGAANLDMVVKLYTTELSPPVIATIMACEIFNVSFENVVVDLEDKQHMNTEFLKKNPLKTIPVLEDDDLIIHDSHAILMYLADAYGTDEAWYPKDHKTRALVNQKLFFDTTVLFPRLKNITYALVVERKPTINKKWLDNIDEGYALMEAFLSKTAFIANDSITIADISVYSNMSCLAQVVPVDENKFPETTRWCKEMKKQPYCVKHNNPSAAIFGDLLKKCQASTSK